MAELTHYNRARRELALAKSTDEVKQIRDKAVAIETYARLANDPTLENNARSIRLRAERRCGQMLKQTVKKGAPKKKVKIIDHSSKLSDLGITKNQSSDWQKLADLPESEFETDVAEGLDTSAILQKHKKKPKPKPQIKNANAERALCIWGQSRDLAEPAVAWKRAVPWLIKGGMAEQTLKNLKILEKWIPQLIDSIEQEIRNARR